MKRIILSVSMSIFLIFGLATPVLAATDPIITNGLCAGANLDINNPNCDTTDDASQKINSLIRRVINFLSLIVGVVAVIMIIIGGFRYITSGGSDTGVTSAKNTILYAIIGLIVVALAQLLVRFILRQVTNA